MNKIKRLRLNSTCIYTALILSSCTASTNIGGFLSDLGVKEAYNVSSTHFTPKDTYTPEIAAASAMNATLHTPTPKDLSIYKLGDLYYMELCFQYNQIASGLARSWCVRGGTDYHLMVFEGEYSDNFGNIPVQAQMVLMSKEEVNDCLQIDIPEVTETAAKLIPKAQFDFSQAKRCKPNPVTYRNDEGKEDFHSLSYYYPEIPKQKSWYHYILEPISWPLQVVEHVPDVAIMMPTVLIVAPCAAISSVQQQMSHPQDSQKEE